MKSKLKKIKDWIAIDGLLHIETSLIIFLFVSIPIHLCYGLFFSIPIGFVVAFMLGCYKELQDIYVQKDNSKIESNHDMLCNLIGVIIGMIFLVIINLIK